MECDKFGPLEYFGRLADLVLQIQNNYKLGPWKYLLNQMDPWCYYPKPNPIHAKKKSQAQSYPSPSHPILLLIKQGQQKSTPSPFFFPAKTEHPSPLHCTCFQHSCSPSSLQQPTQPPYTSQIPIPLCLPPLPRWQSILTYLGAKTQ